MNNTTTVATANASMGAAGAAVVIVTWALSLVHVPVPAEVAAAGMILLSPLVHFVAARIAAPKPTVEAKAP